MKRVPCHWTVGPSMIEAEVEIYHQFIQLGGPPPSRLSGN